MTSLTTKYVFRIRTRTGMVVDNLTLHGRDLADAERKLWQMYRHCEVLEYQMLGAPHGSGANSISFEEVLALVCK